MEREAGVRSTLERLLAQVCPDDTAFAAVDRETPLAQLLGEEPGAIARAVPLRRWEFQAGRHCARQALAVLGAPPVEIPVGPRRMPRFPAGFVGSISHCGRPQPAAIAVVAASTLVAAVGVDVERRWGASAVDPDLITDAEERARRPSSMTEPEFLSIAFSAKEATYKALSPFVERVLDFDEVAVHVEVERFTCSLRFPAPFLRTATVEGRWTTSEDLLLALVVLRRDQLSDPRPDGVP
jgi:4'-phosphopantetheinyl transferase EntD